MEKVTMKLQRLSITTVAICLLFSFQAASGQVLKDVKIVYPASIASISLFTAQANGFFEDHGLRPVLLQVRSQVGIQAQVAGEVDYTLFGGGAGMTAAMRGFPIKVVMFPLRFANYALLSRPNIRSFQDMKKNRWE
jgi:ABC-type nitrate/sulfonate/bicarbonate transport system substrate-binding protein